VLAKFAVGYLFTLIFQKAQLREILLVKKGEREDPSTSFAFKCFTTTSYILASLLKKPPLHSNRIYIEEEQRRRRTPMTSPDFL
jgi:hypothetical protein